MTTNIADIIANTKEIYMTDSSLERSNICSI